MRRVHVDASKAYDVIIQPGAIAQVGRYADAIGCRKCMLACDSTVADLHMPSALRALQAADIDTEVFVFPAGEESKCVDTYLKLIRTLAAKRFSRSDAVIALGGGVTGDLSGFAAATYMRGIHLIQIPTTLLACVDSSVGGKTAVDLPEGKNLLGAFYQPDRVICDPELLATLPEGTFSDGMAEVIKYGMIANAHLLKAIEGGRAADHLEEIIEACVQMKRDIVQADEFDNGERQLLNLGHTFGHAIEALSDFQLSHGKCVAIGMAMITRAAVRRGLCDPQAMHVLQTLLEAYHLPNRTAYAAADIAHRAGMDKKARGGTVSLIVPAGIGKSRIMTVQTAHLIDWVEEGMA